MSMESDEVDIAEEGRPYTVLSEEEIATTLGASVENLGKEHK